MVQIVFDVVKTTVYAQSHCDKRFFRFVAGPVERKRKVSVIPMGYFEMI